MVTYHYRNKSMDFLCVSAGHDDHAEDMVSDRLWKCGSVIRAKMSQDHTLLKTDLASGST